MRYGRNAAVAVLLLAGCAQQTSTTVGSPATPSVTATPDPSPRTAPFLVGASVLLWPAGPGPARQQRPCRAEDVTASAVTRPIVGGVAGVVHLKGDTCSLHISSGPQRLLAADGTALQVHLDAQPPAVNPPRVPRDDIPLGNGDVLWGFTWTGSWCGPAARYVVIEMQDDPTLPGPHGSYGELRVPLSGTAPACGHASGAVLRPGIAGAPGAGDVAADGVLPAPPEWAALHASLTLPASVADPLPAYTFTLRNPTDRAMTLSPCPEYSSLVDVTGEGDDESQLSAVKPLPCAAGTVVPPHAALHFAIPGADFDQGLPHPYGKGSTVTVEVAIAGVATAKAVAHVG